MELAQKSNFHDLNWLLRATYNMSQYNMTEVLCKNIDKIWILLCLKLEQVIHLFLIVSKYRRKRQNLKKFNIRKNIKSLLLLCQEWNLTYKILKIIIRFGQTWVELKKTMTLFERNGAEPNFRNIRPSLVASW